MYFELDMFDKKTKVIATFYPDDSIFIRRKTVEAGVGTRIRVIETGLEYATLRLCAEAVSGTESAISECVRGLRKTHKGYTYVRVE